MSDEAPDSLIPYDEIVQEALRAVVGRVLGEVEATGQLPGEHHFFITFKTGAAGVDIPRHLSEKFPDEMTIVIQNRFWDLKVHESGFEVGLSFNQMPSRLVIPLCTCWKPASALNSSIRAFTSCRVIFSRSAMLSRSTRSTTRAWSAARSWTR